MLLGNLRKYYCIPVGVLGKSMALNILKGKTRNEILHWDDFYSINK